MYTKDSHTHTVRESNRSFLGQGPHLLQLRLTRLHRYDVNVPSGGRSGRDAGPRPTPEPGSLPDDKHILVDRKHNCIKEGSLHMPVPIAQESNPNLWGSKQHLLTSSAAHIRLYSLLAAYGRFPEVLYFSPLSCVCRQGRTHGCLKLLNRGGRGSLTYLTNIAARNSLICELTMLKPSTVSVFSNWGLQKVTYV